MKIGMLATLLLLSLMAGPDLFAQNVDSLAQKAMEAYQQRHFVQSATLFEQAIGTGTKDAVIFYNAACCFALSGRKQKAWSCLERSVELGYRDAGHMQQDSDLVSLWPDQKWKDLMKKLGAPDSVSINYDRLVNAINNIAALLYQYKIRPASMDGGNGSYEGFRIPARMAMNSDGWYQTNVINRDRARIEATSSMGKGTIAVEINEEGMIIESSWVRTGEFSSKGK